MYFKGFNADYIVGVGRISRLHIIGFIRSSSAEKYFEGFFYFVIHQSMMQYRAVEWGIQSNCSGC